MAVRRKLTKRQIEDFVRQKLSTSDVWAKKALLKIYEFQTESEKESGYTHIYNNIGFSGAHSEIMSSFSVQLLSKGWLSINQMKIVRKIIPKYSRQIIMISDINKLEQMVIENK